MREDQSMKKKVLSLFLAGLLALSLMACSSGEQTPITQAQPSPDSQSVDSQGSSQEQSVATTATIESTVLVDQDGIVITAQELVDDSIWGPGVKLLIENNSSQNQIIQCDYAVVNNFMMSSLLFSADVAAGKKSNETLYFTDTVLEEAGITEIAEMDFVFYSVDPDTYQRNFTTDEITLPTSLAGQYQQTIPEEGQELYNQGGLRIVGRYVEEDTLWGAGVVLLIDNQSGQDLLLTCDNMSINGFMVSPFFSARVNNGRMAISNITVFSSDLEANGIQSVENIELSFTGISPDSYQTLVDTGAISFSTVQ